MGIAQPPRVPPRPTQVKIGRVVSDKMDKTALVEVRTLRRHPLYGHVERRSKKYMVHDEDNTAQVGDEVRFCLCRPISRHKSWILMEISRRARGSILPGEQNTQDFREPSEATEAEAAAGEPAEAAAEGTSGEASEEEEQA